jgi:hypothetical protein
MRDYNIFRKGAGHRIRWAVDSDGQRHGEYLSRWAALLDAVDAAWEDGLRGTPSRVVLRATDGAEEICWQPGDPYPYEAPAAKG